MRVYKDHIRHVHAVMDFFCFTMSYSIFVLHRRPWFQRWEVNYFQSNQFTELYLNHSIFFLPFLISHLCISPNIPDC